MAYARNATLIVLTFALACMPATASADVPVVTPPDVPAESAIAPEPTDAIPAVDDTGEGAAPDLIEDSLPPEVPADDSGDTPDSRSENGDGAPACLAAPAEDACPQPDPEVIEDTQVDVMPEDIYVSWIHCIPVDAVEGVAFVDPAMFESDWIIDPMTDEDVAAGRGYTCFSDGVTYGASVTASLPGSPVSGTAHAHRAEQRPRDRYPVHRIRHARIEGARRGVNRPAPAVIVAGRGIAKPRRADSAEAASPARRTPIAIDRAVQSRALVSAGSGGTPDAVVGRVPVSMMLVLLAGLSMLAMRRLRGSSH